jgi:hypothetical protein
MARRSPLTDGSAYEYRRVCNAEGSCNRGEGVVPSETLELGLEPQWRTPAGRCRGNALDLGTWAVGGGWSSDSKRLIATAFS